MTTIENLDSLPILHRVTVTDEHLDVMGHMNIRWYMAFFDDGDWEFLGALGATVAYFEENEVGIFTLEHFIRYLAEVRVGETVGIKARIIGRSENGKRIYYVLYMINETTNRVAATMETLASFADLSIRRTTPFPPHILKKIDVLLAQHTQLDWNVKLSGAISP